MKQPVGFIFYQERNEGIAAPERHIKARTQPLRQLRVHKRVCSGEEDIFLIFKICIFYRNNPLTMPKSFGAHGITKILYKTKQTGTDPGLFLISGFTPHRLFSYAASPVSPKSPRLRRQAPPRPQPTATGKAETHCQTCPVYPHRCCSRSAYTGLSRSDH